MAPLKYVASINDDKLGEDTDPGTTIRYIDIGAVGRSKLTGPPVDLAFGESPSRARRLVQPGDTIVSTVRTYLRAIWAVDEPTEALVVSTGFAVVRPSDADARFLAWALQSDTFVEEVVARSVGVSYPAINPGDLAMIPVPLPLLAQQRRIADFLDDETARIDALIDAKQQMIGAVRETTLRRLSMRLGMAVHVTGRGPEPSSALACSRLRYVAVVHGGLTLGKRYDGETVEYPYLRVANVQNGWLDLAEVKTIRLPARDAASYVVEPGDLLLLEGNGNPDNLGRGVLWRGEIDGTVLHQNHVHVVRSGSRLVPDYLEAAIRTEWVRYFLTGGIGQVSIATLSQDRLGSLPLPVPPVATQRALVGWWHSIRGHADDLVDTLTRQIDLLHERRQALITAAVIGEVEIP